MKSRGFTLIELLGVMIILALLMTIVFPSIINTLKKTSDKINESSDKVLINALNIYMSNHESNYQKTNGYKYIIDLQNLLGEDLIPSEFKINDESIIGVKCVEATYNNGFSYQLKNIGQCEEYHPYKSELLKGSDPILFNGLLTPVIYDGDNWKVTNVNNKWYDYKNQEWANAVILKSDVTKNVGDIVNVDGFDSDVYAMYVWIPRYEYKIEDAASLTVKRISVNFIPSTQTTPTIGYAINSGFTFGDTNLSGIWVGKFETSHTTLSSSAVGNNLNCQNENCATADNLRIVPNVPSLIYNNVSNCFFASRSISRRGNAFGIDSNITNSHMMKNSEWGIVAYLSQSKYGKYGNDNYIGVNKEVYINNSSVHYTGRSGGAPGGSTSINETYPNEDSTEQYNNSGFYTYDDYLLEYNTNTKSSKVTNKGQGASTTGNIYGVYDMSGGAWDYVMGVFSDSSYNLWSGTSLDSNSGFTGKVGTSGDLYTGVSFPNSKYYDVYKAISETTMINSQACDGKMCYGHAVNPEVGNWYGDNSHLVSAMYPWFVRGGSYNRGSGAGVLNGDSSYGSVISVSFRLILSEA